MTAGPGAMAASELASARSRSVVARPTEMSEQRD